MSGLAARLCCAGMGCLSWLRAYEVDYGCVNLSLEFLRTGHVHVDDPGPWSAWKRSALTRRCDARRARRGCSGMELRNVHEAFHGRAAKAAWTPECQLVACCSAVRHYDGGEPERLTVYSWYRCILGASSFVSRLVTLQTRDSAR